MIRRTRSLEVGDRPIVGVITADGSRPIGRREMLAALFDYLHVSDAKIVGYTARSDRQAEVL